MAETLGSLMDKLTIVKLKQWHSEDKERLKSLGNQEVHLQQEMSEYIRAAVQGEIPLERLTFAANKVFKKEGNAVADIQGKGIGAVFSQLADVNCKLWHEQEKVYEFEKVPAEEKDQVVKLLAVLNLERNKCIDTIDKTFQQQIKELVG